MASTDVIRFDSNYMRECAKNTAKAKECVDEAIALLRKANRHDGWRCAERGEINKELDEIKKRLSNIGDNGIAPISSALSRGAEQFSDLETRASTQESQMSEDMRKNWGFKASSWLQRTGSSVSNFFSNLRNSNNSTDSMLPVTKIPELNAFGPSKSLNIESLRPQVGGFKAPEAPGWLVGILNKLLGR